MNPQYFTPRLAIAKVNTLQELNTANTQIQLRHKHYHHLFNLTNVKLPNQRESNFKWRGLPFSVTEMVRILGQIDSFLRVNLANAAIICVGNAHMEEFARVIIRAYIQLCFISAKGPSDTEKRNSILKLAESIVNSHPYFFKEVMTIYRSVSIQSPPLKVLQAFSITPSQVFIPIVQIYSQSRYNDFQLIYTHAIEQELALYYLDLNRPLQTGVGKRYYDNKPQTKYFTKPVVVCGDVKIIVHSYKTLKKVYEFALGFNTHHLDALNKEQGVLVLGNEDLYDRAGCSRQEKIEIQLIYSDYCLNVQCKERANCNDCRDALKKLSNRYTETQSELEKLHRPRTFSEIQTLLSL